MSEQIKQDETLTDPLDITLRVSAADLFGDL